MSCHVLFCLSIVFLFKFLNFLLFVLPCLSFLFFLSFFSRRILNLNGHIWGEYHMVWWREHLLNFQRFPLLKNIRKSQLLITPMFFFYFLKDIFQLFSVLCGYSILKHALVIIYCVAEIRSLLANSNERFGTHFWFCTLL